MGGTGGVDARTSKYRKTEKTQLPGDRQRDFLCTLERDQVAVDASRLATLVNGLRLFQKVANSGPLAKVEHDFTAAVKEEAWAQSGAQRRHTRQPKYQNRRGW